MSIATRAKTALGVCSNTGGSAVNAVDCSYLRPLLPAWTCGEKPRREVTRGGHGLTERASRSDLGHREGF